MTQWDKPINYLQFLGIKAQLSRELRLLPAEWIRVMGQNLDSAGEFQNLLDTGGKVLCTEDSGAAINGNTVYLDGRIAANQHPTVGTVAAAGIGNSKRLLGATGSITLAGGTISDHGLVPAKAGYYGIIIIKGLYSDTTFTAALDFEDEDNTDLSGIPASVSIALTANTMTGFDPPIIGWGAADNKVLEVDITGGAGAEVLYLAYEYFYQT